MTVYSEMDNYTAYFTFESGDSEDDLSNFSGLYFSTFDRDNDQSSERHCAMKCRAGFWYSDCIRRGNINQPSGSVCGGFLWESTDTNIEMQETKLYLSCNNKT